MKKFSIKIHAVHFVKEIEYNHYLSEGAISKALNYADFCERYPLFYRSRKFDKMAHKRYLNNQRRTPYTVWFLDNICHRIKRPAIIHTDDSVSYYENGVKIK